jgi:hypothetical protein
VVVATREKEEEEEEMVATTEGSITYCGENMAGRSTQGRRGIILPREVQVWVGSSRSTRGSVRDCVVNNQTYDYVEVYRGTLQATL